MTAVRATVSRWVAALPLPAPRPRTRRDRARRVPPVAFLVVGVVALLLLGGGWLWLRDSSLVAVRTVGVTGISGPDAPAVRAALRRAGDDMTTLHVRHDALTTAVSTYPVVRTLRVSSHFPHKLTVHVVEEHPIAKLTVGGRAVAAIADGKLLPRFDGIDGLPAVPVRAEPVGGRVRDARTAGAVAALTASPAPLRAKVKSLAWAGAHGYTVVMRRGPDIYLGAATRLPEKWVAATRVLADPSAKGADYIDVRVPERPAAGGVPAPPDPTPSTTTATPPAAATPTPASPAAPATSPSSGATATPSVTPYGTGATSPTAPPATSATPSLGRTQP